MAQETSRTLMSYCPDIKVLDCTLRDGGLVNNFRFDDKFVKNLYQANVKAGVDYMEFGYKASKEIFDVKDFGKWKFCDEEDIRAIVGENNTDLKIAVMTDVGRTDYKKDILNCEDSVIDLVRTATYIHQIPTAIEMIEDAKEKGYETTVNVMAVSKVNDKDLEAGLELAQHPMCLFRDILGRASWWCHRRCRCRPLYRGLVNTFMMDLKCLRANFCLDERWLTILVHCKL